MKVIIDSDAWVEYLDGSVKGRKVEQILSREDAYTLPLTIAEVVSRAQRLHKDAALAYETLVTDSKITEIDAEISKEAGLFHAVVREKIKDFGIVDSFILVTARKINAKILTGDMHFKGFKEAILI